MSDTLFFFLFFGAIVIIALVIFRIIKALSSAVRKGDDSPEAKQKASQGCGTLVLIVIVAFVGISIFSKRPADKTPETEQRPVPVTNNAAYSEDERYGIGETWTVPGQWALTIDSVRIIEDRVKAIQKEPAAVYGVTYTLENLGYKKHGDSGLYISLETHIKDSAGDAGYAYIISTDSDVEPVYADQKKQMEVGIGVDHVGDFQISVFDSDMNGNMQRALFNITVPQT